jgi:hypothetical protein
MFLHDHSSICLPTSQCAAVMTGSMAKPQVARFSQAQTANLIKANSHPHGELNIPNPLATK